MAGAVVNYPQDQASKVDVPSPTPPTPKVASQSDPINVDTSLDQQGNSNLNPALSGAPNVHLDPVVYFPTVSQTDFQAANLSASGINLSRLGSVAGSPTSTSNVRSSIIAYAKKFLGVPYVWGGTSPKGFDCSGFVQYVLRANGKSMPRIALEQANSGKVVSLSQLQPGDLVAWNDNNVPGADHIAIYLGNGQIIEAPHTGANVRIRKLGSGGFDKNAYGVHITYPGE
jgi:cell wall-associated NlpC family hydrolase